MSDAKPSLAPLVAAQENESVSGKRCNEESGASDEAKKPRLETTTSEDTASTDKAKKRKVALLMAYSGQGYFGMQRNPGTRTIEEELLNALLRAGLISEEGHKQPQQLQFQRAARTDKGVSAARQVVSLKMPADGPIIEQINAELPSQIRIFGLCRVTKNFNSKGNCDARTYSYSLPTLALSPASETVDDTYRVSEDVLDLTKSTLRLFEGTHNFHNFTARKHAMDPSANRYIMKFECGSPFILGDLEFVEFRVKGQSFMLHQIRKMIGLTIAVVRGLASADVIEKAWQAQRLDLPVAPGLGLVLEEVHYDKYDRKYGTDGIHETLTWAGTQDAINKFKLDHIMPTILQGEKDDKSMVSWLETLPLHSFGVRERPHVSEQNVESNGSSEETHGLATLGRAVSLLENQEQNNHSEPQNLDGLSALAQAAQVISDQDNATNDQNKNHS